MFTDLLNLVPPEAVRILLVLFLSFLVGVEREEQRGTADHYFFGGVRTFPLVGIVGYATALLAGAQILLVAVGFAVVGAFLVVSYRHKLDNDADAGATSEFSGLATYLIGAMVAYDHYWIATTLAVASLLLLELKAGLETLARRAAPGEILTFAKFLLLTAVVLPALPDRAFGPFQLNPFRIWLVVVAVSAVSYGGYVVQRASRGHGGIVAAAILGGAYSSTVTTVVLAKQSRTDDRPWLFAGAMLMASGMMFLRVVVLLALFNGVLAARLGPVFGVLAAVALAVGFLLTTRRGRGLDALPEVPVSRNPLELGAALLFALIFVTMLIGTDLAVAYLGQRGVYVLAAIMGVADVDPFIMGMTQQAGAGAAVPVAASAILITVASNNVVKGIYARVFAARRTGWAGLAVLVGLALCGLLPLLVMW